MTAPQHPPVEPTRHTLSAEILHDLRTPINQIIGYSEMLVEQAEDEGQPAFVPDLHNIHTAARQLLALLNNVGPSRPAAAPGESGTSTGAAADTPWLELTADATTLAAAPDTSQALILVVDDNAMNRDVLSRQLARQGYGVALAVNGDRALEALRTQVVDLVLLDIMMPDMDGYAVLKEIKADEALRHIPVIMVTALDELDSVVRCINLGAEDYLHKPFNPTLLKARIGASLEKKRARDHDIAERRQAEQSAARLEAIVEASDDAIISWTLDGVIAKWNRGAEKMYGYTAAEMVGSPIARLHPPGNPDYESLLLGPIKRGELVNQIETVYVHKDGSFIDISLSASSLRDADDVITGAWAIARDITARKQIDRLKSEFISTVSHELRTPLTSIRGALGLVTGGVTGPVPPQAVMMLDIAYKNSERLVRLINDILDVEKIEAGEMTFDTQALELTPLVAQAIDANRGFAQQFGVSYALAHAARGLRVNGNADRLIQVLNNLLANAAKFSPRNGIVTVSVERRDAMARVTVVDQGMGIPAEFRDRIFQKFAQADSSDTRQKGGTGLGLSIARAIVEKHGGQLGFASEAGAGAAFFFDLPADQEIALPPGLDRDGLQSPQILICADDQESALLISTVLQQEGYLTDIASDTEQARRLLARQHYDGLTLDLQLPEQDRRAFIRELRDQDQTPMLPIVMIADIGGDERPALEGDSIGLVDWIEKPVEPARLRGAVQRLLEAQAGQRPRIMHVEDDPDVVAVVGRILGNVAAISATPGVREARRKLDAEQVDLVILDLRLTDGSGVELLPLLAKRGIPVVTFSAYDIPTTAAAQVSAALVKSNTSNHSLFATITALLKGGEPRRTV